MPRVPPAVAGKQLLLAVSLRPLGPVVSEPPHAEDCPQRVEYVSQGVEELGVGGLGRDDDDEKADPQVAHCQMSRAVLKFVRQVSNACPAAAAAAEACVLTR